MATTLLQATVGAGKTEAALACLSHVIDNPQKPFAKVWVLLATKRQEVAFRQRLIELQDGRFVYFNAEFFNFYELNARLLNLAGVPPRRINEAARAGLLRKIINDLLRTEQLPNFASIARTPGFLRVVASLIYELKQNRVFPETYEAAALTAKDHELARIYSAYQDLVQQHGLVDREGEGWLALEALENNAHLASDVDLLLVDGYDQFTPVQAMLLATLSQHIDDLVITLTKDPNSEQQMNSALTEKQRFTEAQERLIHYHQASSASYHIQEMDEPQIIKHPDLIALARNIFVDQPPVPSGGAIQLIEAPEPIDEVAAVLRHVKRKLLAGIRPDDILIALRDWSRYHTYIDLFVRLYQVPAILHYGEPLIKNPALTTLLNLLALPGKDPDALSSFRRRDLLDVLRSPYVDVPGFTDDVIDHLDLVSQKKQILGGRQHWLQAVRELDSVAFDYLEEEDEEPQALLTSQEIAELSLALEDFFTHIIPEPRATYQAYILWLEQLIGVDPLDNPDDQVTDIQMAVPSTTEALQPFEPYSLNMPRCIRNLHDPDLEYLISRDVAALNHLKELLGGMLSTQDFLRTALQDSAVRITWHDLFADLQTAIKHLQPTQRTPIRSGRVLITTATEARGLPQEHIVILGLSEGIFPAQVSEDPLYLDSERRRLTQAGVMLQTQSQRSDDNGIFYELISQARQSLTLSRPHVRDGKFWVESHLWRMTRAVFTDLPLLHIGIGQVVPPSEVTALDEALITVADALSQSPRSADIAQLYQWVRQTHPDYWQRIEQGRATELARLSDAAHNSYSGQLERAELIEVVAETVDNQYTWSATRLNAYGQCPYRFFAGYMLKLEEYKPPHEGLDALQMGSLNHDILEATYRAIKEEGITIASDHADLARDILHEEAAKAFQNAPTTYQFRASALWHEEQAVILRRLTKLVELDFSAESPLNHFGTERRPYALELGFGFGTDHLRIPIAGDTIKVRGKIDRIDWVDGRLVVIDYKTGSTRISTSHMQQGRNFQMMIYLLALRAKYPKMPIVGGLFWHIRDQAVSGKLEFDADMTDHDAIQQAQAHISAYLHRIRQGDFTVQPTQASQHRCTSYCEFYQLCRLTNTYQYKDH